jgi:hypothetical protein
MAKIWSTSAIVLIIYNSGLGIDSDSLSVYTVYSFNAPTSSWHKKTVSKRDRPTQPLLGYTFETEKSLTTLHCHPRYLLLMMPSHVPLLVCLLKQIQGVHVPVNDGRITPLEQLFVSTSRILFSSTFFADVDEAGVNQG